MTSISHVWARSQPQLDYCKLLVSERNKLELSEAHAYTPYEVILQTTANAFMMKVAMRSWCRWYLINKAMARELMQYGYDIATIFVSITMNDTIWKKEFHLYNSVEAAPHQRNGLLSAGLFWPFCIKGYNEILNMFLLWLMKWWLLITRWLSSIAWIIPQKVYSTSLLTGAGVRWKQEVVMKVWYSQAIYGYQYVSHKDHC